jgi:hypothetical protein
LEFDNSEAIAELRRIEQARRKAEWAAKCDAFVEGAKKMALLAFGIVVLWLIIWKILKALS